MNSQDGPPSQLYRAVWLMYAGAIVTPLWLLMSFGVFDRDAVRQALTQDDAGLSAEEVDQAVNAILPFTIVLCLVVGGLWLLMAIFSKRGKGWARVLASVFGLVYVMFMLWNVIGAMAQGGGPLMSLPGLLSMVSLAVAGLALFYLWTMPVRTWFDQQRSPMR